MIKVEKWRDCKGFEEFYEVSTHGRIRRKAGKTIYKDGRVAHFSQTILKPSVNHKGYSKVYLSVKSKKHSKFLHRLVALSFIPNPDNLATVNHIDCNKLNNSPANLEWLSNNDNMRHAFKNGRFKERDKTTILNIKHMGDKLSKNK